MEVLIPKSLGGSKAGPFAELMLSEKQMARAFLMFQRVLKNSFDEDERQMGKAFRERVQTGAELKRRADMMARWFRVFRGDLGYSLAKIEAELGRALRCELDGGIYTPTQGRATYGVPEGDTQ